MDKKTIELLYYKNAFVNTINRMMYNNGWSIKQLSEKAELPYESVKKLVSGKINNPTIYTVIKLSKAFGCGLDLLIENKLSYNLQSELLSERAVTLLTEIANFETYLAEHNKTHSDNYITTLIPTGIIHDGMLFDSIFTDFVDISAYQEDFGNIIMCGLKIIGENLHPTYLNNDILLIGRDRFPMDGENGIFLIGHKAYIRTYFSGCPIKLVPINGDNNTITITDINDVHFFGRILTIVRK